MLPWLRYSIVDNPIFEKVMISFWILIILSLLRWLRSTDDNEKLSQGSNAKFKNFSVVGLVFIPIFQFYFTCYPELILKVRAKNENEEPAVAPQQSAWEKQGVLLKRGPKNSEVCISDCRKMPSNGRCTNRDGVR